MRLFLFASCLILFSCSPANNNGRRIFDVHLHGSKDVKVQVEKLEAAGVRLAAISSSWELQNSYKKNSNIDFLYGLMFPCPDGKVPYSLQPCFQDGAEWPPIDWVEQQIRNGRIDFIGEVLSQYHGISSSDSSLYPYYALAEKYALPVGIHTGGAGPGHGSPNFKMELGNPDLLKELLEKFPTLKVWIMHAGDQYYKECIAIMKAHEQVYADISVLSNPDIVPGDRFALIIRDFVDAGLNNRLMFGSDNGDIEKVIRAVEGLSFLDEEQKEKIFYSNAIDFFTHKQMAK